MITIRFFARFREFIGSDTIEVAAPADCVTVAQILDKVFCETSPELAPLRPGGILLAVNREYATLETIVADNDEIALMPQISGG